MVLKVWSLGQQPPTASGELQEMQVLWPHPRLSRSATLGSGPATCGLQAFWAIIMYYSEATTNSRLWNVGHDLVKTLVSYLEGWHLMPHCKQHKNVISHYKSFRPLSPHSVLLLATLLTPFSPKPPSFSFTCDTSPSWGWRQVPFIEQFSHT